LAQKRRLVFFVTLTTALIIVACGRQVTPNPPGLGAGGAPPGYMAIFFDTAAPFNFSTYQYMVVLNTTGSGVTPSTQSIQTNWAGYSFALIALGNGISSYAEPVYFAHGSNPHIAPGWISLGTTPQTFSYNLNNNGTGTEFSILAQRRLFDFNPSPSPSPSASPSNVWTFNAFVTQQAQPGGQWIFYDSMGAGGPVPPEYFSPTLCMSEPFDNTYYALDTTGISDPSGQIVTIEIANNPASPAPCP
jgi:hypothetical protein